MFAAEKRIGLFDDPSRDVFELPRRHILSTHIDLNILLHAPRQMLGTLMNLCDDLVHQAVGIRIDIVILHLE